MEIQEIWRVQGKKADFEELGKKIGRASCRERV